MRNSFHEYVIQRDKAFPISSCSEVSQVVGEGTATQFAQKILDELQKGTNHVFGIIYWMMTYTPETPQNQNHILDALNDKYTTHMPRIPMPSFVETEEGSGWIHFKIQTERYRRQRVGPKDEGIVQFKEYFSIHTDVATLRDTLNHLFKNLASVMTQLYNIATQNNDQIQLKIPDTLWSFLEHPDTIVVHYRNKNSGPQIRSIVEKAFPKQFGRGIRTKSGFDIKHPDPGKPEASINNSHSELISWAISGTIIAEKEKILKKYNALSLGEKLLEVISKFSQMDEKSLYSAYLQGKGFN